ncbi:amino acid adenylation domain-containing protein [Micromonospora nigra]|uniref:Amino acid adenylation domain-containing protein n=1 Tax=Micromonospora nigra TaxID=145857 RepID=A0A1C6RBU0_9ACTN|nr:non-ribosomal peptide synthetase [Micromonospora nigra]SCL14603.1 amino acid adenylation domain-containing protein [Micromonospora nigra]
MTHRDAAEAARRQVGLLLESPADFTVGMFGAWSVGLGVLPLPVEFPDARLREMLADCSPRLLLTSPTQADRAARLVADLPHPPTVVPFDVAPAAGATGAAAPATDAGPGPDDPAYTVYTSGSTGRPKGVLIRQGQVAHLVAWEGQAWELGPWVRMAQTLSLGFDFGLQELFTALPYGGCVVVPAPADRRNARSYVRFLRRERVTVLFTTPSYADQLVATGEPLPDLRLVLLGGEVLKRSTVTGLRTLVAADCRLVNGYGPTEATVNCLAYEIPAKVPDEDLPAVLPVGRPSAASRIWLADDDDRPLPVGALGNILIAGPGVADGYLHRPEATAERFVTDRSGDRYYRTGDLAHLDPDVGFVVVGRADRQVKVRGFRVELGEVEFAMRDVPGVVACAALVVEEPRRLVAFVTGDRVDPTELLRLVGARLPVAMVPEQVVTLDELPMTANGKLDETPLRQAAQREYTEVLPGSAGVREVEAAVCRIWADALALSTIAPDVNVFDAGAHSLVVTRVHHQLQVSLGVTFPIHYLFEYPCPRDLAGHLAARRTTRPTSPAPALARPPKDRHGHDAP